jgi:hypothetical protein
MAFLESQDQIYNEVVAAVALALPIRGGLDAMLLDWRVLRICAWQPAGSRTRVRVSVRSTGFLLAISYAHR